MARSSDSQLPRKTLFLIGRILLLSMAAIAILALIATTSPKELWPLLAQAIGIGTMCGISYLVVRLSSQVHLSWRAILRGIGKALVVLIVCAEVLVDLLSPDAGPTRRTTALLVIGICCASLAYWLFVSSHVRLRLPGIGEELAEAEGEANRKEPHEPATVQVTRLSSRAARVDVVNDTPLPVLRAQTSVVLVREEDARASAPQDAQPIMGPAFSLRAHGTRPTSLGNAFNHVGIFRLQSAGVRVYSLFGLLSRRRGLSSEWRVRVVPNVYRIPYGIPRDRTAMQASLGIPDTPADALDYDRVRDYRPGDALKTIHWKLVAHSQGELYTKLFETPTLTTATLTIDPFGAGTKELGVEEAYHLHDTMLEGAFSLIEHAHENGVAGRLRFVRRDGTLAEAAWAGLATRGWFVETAKRPARTNEDAAQSIAAIQSMRAAREGYAIFATSSLTEVSVGALIARYHAGVPLLVVHALPASGAEATRQRELDARLRAASIVVIGLTDGSQIVREVSSS